MALYFGTFNPMHAGHLAILNYLRKKAFDEVRMVVSPVSPFKPGGAQTAQDRLEAVRQKVAQLCPDVVVSDVEFNLPKPNYTINTLRHLQQGILKGIRKHCVSGQHNAALLRRKSRQGTANRHCDQCGKEGTYQKKAWSFPHP